MIIKLSFNKTATADGTMQRFSFFLRINQKAIFGCVTVIFLSVTGKFLKWK